MALPTAQDIIDIKAILAGTYKFSDIPMGHAWWTYKVAFELDPTLTADQWAAGLFVDTIAPESQ